MEYSKSRFSRNALAPSLKIDVVGHAAGIAGAKKKSLQA